MGPRRSLRGARRPAYRVRHHRGRGRRRRVSRALPREGRRARRRGARRGGRGARAHRVRGRSAADLRAPPLCDEHGRPRARRARRSTAGEGRGARDPAPLLRARVGRPGRRDRRRRPRGRGARPLAPPPALAPQVPPVPALRARGEGLHREVRLRRRGLVAALRGAARRPARQAGRRRGVARDGDGAVVRARPRRAPDGGRRDHRGARPGSPNPHVRLQHDPARQVDRRPAARLPDVDLVAQPRERNDGRGRGGARRGDDVPVRGRPAVLPPEGEAARARPPRSLRPDGPDRRGHEQGLLGRGARCRRRRLLGLLGRGRYSHRALLRRELDRRAGAARQAHGRLLRDHRARCPPVHPHELHGRPPLDPDARARARARPPRRACAAARPVQLVHAADDRRDRVGLRRGADLRAAPRGRG